MTGMFSGFLCPAAERAPGKDCFDGDEQERRFQELIRERNRLLKECAVLRQENADLKQVLAFVRETVCATDELYRE